MNSVSNRVKKSIKFPKFSGYELSKPHHVNPRVKTWKTYKPPFIHKLCWLAVGFFVYTYYELGGFAQFLEINLMDLKPLPIILAIGYGSSWLKKRSGKYRTCSCGGLEFECEQQATSEIPTQDGETKITLNFKLTCKTCGGFHYDTK